MKIYWKVVTADDKSVYAPAPLAYPAGFAVYPRKGDGPLAAFRTRREARSFAWSWTRGSSAGAKVVKIAGEESESRNGFWQRNLCRMRAADVPPGTVYLSWCRVLAPPA